MWQDYFIVDGTKYHTGTVFIIDFNGKHREAVFICYSTSANMYKCKIDLTTWMIAEKDFHKNIVDITHKIDASVRMPVIKTKKDVEIDSLFWGWPWYIFLMGISIIFNNTIILWILISVVFFNFRKKQIEKEGTYIEW